MVTGLAWLPSLASAQARPATAVTDACRVLSADAQARSRFPGAEQRLCTPGFPVDATCAARSLERCGIDALCTVRTTFVCDRAPCPPGGPSRSSCVASATAPLAASIARFPLCLRSGGAWVALPGAEATTPWRGVCSCMGPSVEAILFTRWGQVHGSLRSPLTYFVHDRGCVVETALCKEHGGTWVARPVDDPARPRCEIDGRAVAWTQRVKVGFEED